MHDDSNPIETFIARWQDADGRERANYQLFLTELAAVLHLPRPEPATADDAANAYVFERRVGFRHGDGTESWGYIDLYRRGAFVLEAKDVHETNAQRYDQGMLRARSQAENYARALPADEGRPPFVLVVDVGRSIELYSEFSRSGATYTPFPDPRSHRIRLTDLREPALCERLRAIWLDPLSLDPSRRAAIVTREIAAHLARLARTLEDAGHAPQLAAGFLTRCLFTMFAEDVGLLPANAFRGLLEDLQRKPQQFVPLVGELWRAMDTGEFSVAIRADLLRFNGKLFKHPDVLPLDPTQIGLLLEAAAADWREVEPAIFGTLLERALDPEERHALGAHYTPRAYVERLVLPTVIEPLREDWKTAQATALTLAAEGHQGAALDAIAAFHHQLCNVRVLDPACGSGNFLYVTLEHMKRLEGEVLNAFDELDPDRQAARQRQGALALEGERADPFGGESVDPHQLLGIELNPRAAAIAELVLWIGYLQWHFRSRSDAPPAEPVLKDFRNIECRDAVLACERMEYATDERGVPLTRWDGKSMQPSPVTGEPIPDETKRVPLERYIEPRKAEWPRADFVVGNPPFIGAANMRRALGDGYVEALRGTWPEMPDSADLVMYWWRHAAQLTRDGQLHRFGFITTNSIRQTFNRRVLEPFLADAKQPLSLVFAVPDHPWVDAADGAAVRIAMTVATPGNQTGQLFSVTDERAAENGEVAVTLRQQLGAIHADLRIGADVAGAVALQSMEGLSCPGFKLHGAGFIVTSETAVQLGLGRVPGIEQHIRPYRNGRDLAATPRGVMVIDLFGLTAEETRNRFPSLYQHVLERVKPERDTNNRATYRENWWIFGEPRGAFRPALAGLPRYIATIETAKHRVFQFLGVEIAPDNKLIAIALDDAHALGVLTSAIHVTWALAAGSWLGVGNDPVYVKSRCFETFPFPAATEPQQTRIRALGEQLDAHRKRQQAAYRDLTLTGMYNVLDKLRAGEPLTAKDRAIHEHGLVSVLRQLHDELDLAVLAAYGWSDLAPLLARAHAIAPETLAAAGCTLSVDAALVPEDAARVFSDAILERLVALNHERAAEERRGLVRWLRPDFQHPQAEALPSQAEIATAEETAPRASAAKRPWPKELPDQVRAVADALGAAASPLDVDALAACFSARGRWRERLPTILDTLVAIGRIRVDAQGRYAGA